jgi:hypothetical protein
VSFSHIQPADPTDGHASKATWCSDNAAGLETVKVYIKPVMVFFSKFSRWMDDIVVDIGAKIGAAVNAVLGVALSLNLGLNLELDLGLGIGGIIGLGRA